MQLFVLTVRKTLTSVISFNPNEETSQIVYSEHESHNYYPNTLSTVLILRGMHSWLNGHRIEIRKELLPCIPINSMPCKNFLSPLPVITPQSDNPRDLAYSGLQVAVLTPFRER